MHAAQNDYAGYTSKLTLTSIATTVRRLACVAALSVLGAGCNSGSGNAADELPGLPVLDFWLRAIAAGETDEFTVECGLDYIVDIAGEVSRTSLVVEYVGTMGGEARRSLLRADGSGVAFFADAFSEVQVLLQVPDRVQINLINVPPDPEGVSSRFWSEQLQFEGRLIGDQIFGDWLCAPLDTEVNGINDNEIFVPGTWLSEPIDG